MTTPIEARGNETLEFLESMRQRRALKFSAPEGDQLVPLSMIDNAILLIAKLSNETGAMTDAELRRFLEAWHDH